MRSDSYNSCKNEYLEQQPVQFKLQMTKKSLKKTQYYCYIIVFMIINSHCDHGTNSNMLCMEIIPSYYAQYVAKTE